MSENITFYLNDEDVSIKADSKTPLLYILRNDFSLNSPKYGCGLGECGACSILIDNKIARSCITPLAAAANRTVQTLEGLGSIENQSEVQKAFIKEQAAQCGYCMNGMIITATAFLNHCKSKPSKQAIKEAMQGNLCRCGTHLEILKAIESAAEKVFPINSSNKQHKAKHEEDDNE